MLKCHRHIDCHLRAGHERCCRLHIHGAEVIVQHRARRAKPDPFNAADPTRAGIIDQAHAVADAVVLHKAGTRRGEIHNVRCRKEQHVSEVMLRCAARVREHAAKRIAGTRARSGYQRLNTIDSAAAAASACADGPCAGLNPAAVQPAVVQRQQICILQTREGTVNVRE